MDQGVECANDQVSHMEVVERVVPSRLDFDDHARIRIGDNVARREVSVGDVAKSMPCWLALVSRPSEFDKFDRFRQTHVEAAVDGGSVKLPLNSNDCVAVTAACGRESIFWDGNART